MKIPANILIVFLIGLTSFLLYPNEAFAEKTLSIEEYGFSIKIPDELKVAEYYTP